MKHILFYTLLITALFIVSCNKDPESKEQPSRTYGTTIDTLSIAKPSNLKLKVRLTPEAKKATENWIFYENLTKAVDSIPSSTLGHLKEGLDRFVVLYETEEEAKEAEVPLTPKEVQTNAITARLLAIQTRVNATQNEANRNTPNPEKLSIQIGLIQNAYQDLNLQLNGVFSTSVKDLLEEIKEENRLKSIKQEEGEEEEESIVTQDN